MEPHHIERHERGLRVQGVNPTRGLSKLHDSRPVPAGPAPALSKLPNSPVQALSKLPNSPIHFKHSQPTRLAMSPGDDCEWSADVGSPSLPPSAIEPDPDITVPWKSEVRASPAAYGASE